MNDRLEKEVNELTRQCPDSLLQTFVNYPEYEAKSSTEASNLLQGKHGNVDPVKILGGAGFGRLKCHGWISVVITKGKLDHPAIIDGSQFQPTSTLPIDAISEARNTRTSTVGERDGRGKVSSDVKQTDDRPRWGLVNVTIDYKGYDVYHQCCLLIDHDTQTIEEYDPQGPNKYNASLGPALATWCNKMFPRYLFLACSYYCDAGVQSSEEGNCSILVYLWVHTRMTSTGISQQQLAEWLMLLKIKGLLETLLLRFSTWLTVELDVLDQPRYRTILYNFTHTVERLKRMAEKTDDRIYLDHLNSYTRDVERCYDTARFDEFSSLIDRGFPSVDYLKSQSPANLRTYLELRDQLGFPVTYSKRTLPSPPPTPLPTPTPSPSPLSTTPLGKGVGTVTVK